VDRQSLRIRNGKRGEELKASPPFGQEIGQYQVQTLAFQVFKNATSMAEITPPDRSFLLDPATQTKALAAKARYASTPDSPTPPALLSPAHPEIEEFPRLRPWRKTTTVTYGPSGFIGNFESNRMSETRREMNSLPQFLVDLGFHFLHEMASSLHPLFLHPSIGHFIHRLKMFSRYRWIVVLFEYLPAFSSR
jgi:hypothetical protein